MKKVLKWVGIIFIVFIVLGVIAGGNKSDNNEPEQQEQMTPKKEVIQKPVEITAQELADDFDENQVAAEAKWSGKLVKFNAKISNITDTGLSFTDVSSKDFSMTQISCQIKDKDQLMPLKNEQMVTVKGIVGGQTIGVISLDDCEVVE